MLRVETFASRSVRGGRDKEVGGGATEGREDSPAVQRKFKQTVAACSSQWTPRRWLPAGLETSASTIVWSYRMHTVSFAVVVALTTLVYPSVSFTPTQPQIRAPPPGAHGPARALQQCGRRLLITTRTGYGTRRSPVHTVQASVSNYIGDGFDSTAEEGAWLKVSEGVTAEMAEDCSVEEAAGIANIVTTLMESCNAKKQRLPFSAADVLQALLSHPAGTQAFWTTFLTDPDLDKSVQEPFEPALIRSVERFPELNIGVLSSCLAMSATEEALFKEEGDEFMRENAAVSKDRALALIKSIARQPDPKRGEHCRSSPLDPPPHKQAPPGNKLQVLAMPHTCWHLLPHHFIVMCCVCHLHQLLLG